MNLEVGEHYLTEDGRIIKIVKKEEKDLYLDSDDYFYNDIGVNDIVNTNRNLIAHIPKELHWNLMYNIKNFHTNKNVTEKTRRKYNNYINCCVSKNKD